MQPLGSALSGGNLQVIFEEEDDDSGNNYNGTGEVDPEVEPSSPLSISRYSTERFISPTSGASSSPQMRSPSWRMRSAVSLDAINEE